MSRVQYSSQRLRIGAPEGLNEVKVNFYNNIKMEKDKNLLPTNEMLNADWRSVKDETPVIIPNSNGGCSEEVLVWINSKNRIEYKEQRQIAYYTKDGWCYQYGEPMSSDDEKGVTHWIPLPLPPISV